MAKRKAPVVRVFHEAGKKLTLVTRPHVVELKIGKVPILTSATLGTEGDFGALAAKLATRPNARVLIGGLGFGATLRAALRVLGPDAEVIIVERLRTIIDLLGGQLKRLGMGVLEDPRVRLVNADVAEVIAREKDLDVILLDVDNAPRWASFEDNSKLYGLKGLAIAKESLRPGGAWAVWAGYPVDAFPATLASAGFETSEIPFMENGKLMARAYVGVKKA